MEKQAKSKDNIFVALLALTTILIILIILQNIGIIQN